MFSRVINSYNIEGRGFHGSMPSIIIGVPGYDPPYIWLLDGDEMMSSEISCYVHRTTRTNDLKSVNRDAITTSCLLHLSSYLATNRNRK